MCNSQQVSGSAVAMGKIILIMAGAISQCESMKIQNIKVSGKQISVDHFAHILPRSHLAFALSLIKSGLSPCRGRSQQSCGYKSLHSH
jgi:hypothetical protein